MLTRAARSHAAAYGLRNLGAGIALFAIVMLPAGLTLFHTRAIPAAAMQVVYIQPWSAVYGVSDSMLATRSSRETSETVLLTDLLWLHKGSGTMGVAAFLLPARSNIATRITALKAPRDVTGLGEAGECGGDGRERRTDASEKKGKGR